MSERRYGEARPTRPERRKQGRELRKQAPRKSAGVWRPPADRRDPLSLLQEQDKDRVQHLVPIKYGRMSASPFAFLRGSAVVMASDLASTPATGLRAQLCGDAHVANFGVFATPERTLVFDINDFDETYPGPWEWDLKRLAASAVVAGRENGYSDKVNRKLVLTISSGYRDSMQHLAQMRTLDVWYYYVEADKVLDVLEKSSKKAKKSARKMIAKARTRTHSQTMDDLTEVVDGKRRILNDPPLLVRLSEHLSQEEKNQITEQDVEDNWLQYLDSLPEERRYLLSRFRISDGALRVGGVGSVGTRCTIILLEGGAEDDALILQQKEAGPSVLEPYVDGPVSSGNAERVVVGQRMMQATSDIFLGWHKSTTSGLDFYWRQLKDMKGSVDVESLDQAGFETYVKVCSYCLARAHARTGDAAAISGYLGTNDVFANAIADFSVAYADQTERDYQALAAAVKSGRIVAETGI